MAINVNWMLLPFDRHLDGGFGYMASSFEDAADRIVKTEEQFQGADYVACFLLRHSIELSLKSMILILHKSQKIPFPALTKSGAPKIDSGKPLYGTHSLLELYSHFERVINENWEKVKQPGWTNWSDVPLTVSEGILRADKIDPGSFWFRYPDTDNPANDRKAPGREKQIDQLVSEMNNRDGPAQKLLLMIDSNDNIVEAFDFAPDSMKEEIDFLSQLASDLTSTSFGMHCEMSATTETDA
jgi:hypothetical protein